MVIFSILDLMFKVKKMNETIELKTLDNHILMLLFHVQTKPKGGLVVIQEIFGVNEHIREVCKIYERRLFNYCSLIV